MMKKAPRNVNRPKKMNVPKHQSITKFKRDNVQAILPYPKVVSISGVTWPTIKLFIQLELYHLLAEVSR